TVLSLSAIAALIVTGYAASQTAPPAQTVQLLNGSTVSASCTYSQMTVLPNGGIAVTCGSASGPGTFTITSTISSLATSAPTNTTAVKITRSNGTTGAVNVTLDTNSSGAGVACSVSPSTLSWNDTESGSKPVSLTAGGTSGSCVIKITPDGGAATGGLGQVSIAIVSPDDPVVFAFAQSNSNAQVGQSNPPITVTRTGGTAGQWTVPITISGDLTIG